MTSQWKNINDEPVQIPLRCETVEQAVELYGSMYNSLQDGKLPPTVGLPSEILREQTFCMVLSSASKAASTRTKQQLNDLRNCYDFDFYGMNFLDIALSDPNIKIPEKYRPNPTQ